MKERVDHDLNAIKFLIEDYDNGKLNFSEMIDEINRMVRDLGTYAFDEGFHAGLADGAPWEEGDVEEYSVEFEDDFPDDLDGGNALDD